MSSANVDSISQFGPRIVVASSGMRAYKVVIPVIYAIVCIACWSVCLQQITDLTALAQHGVQVQGRVLDKWEDSGKSSARHLRYSFPTAGGEQTGEDKVGRLTYEAYDTGMSLPITYLPEDSTIRRIGDADMSMVADRRGVWNMVLLGLTLVAAFTYAVLLSAFGYQRRLLSTGVCVNATILSSTPNSSKEDYRTVKVSFTATDGIERFVTFQIASSPSWSKYAGTVIPYVYPPEWPQGGRLVPSLSLVKVVNEV